MASFTTSLKTPAYGALALSLLSSSTSDTISVILTPAGDSTTLQVKEGTIDNVATIVRFLGRSLANKLPVYGASLLEGVYVDKWIDFAGQLGSRDFNIIQQAMTDLEQHLALRTYLVGYNITSADIAVWGALKGAPAVQKQVKGKTLPQTLARWYDLINMSEVCQAAITLVQSTVLTNNKSKKDQGSFEINLPDAKMGEVVTRFPPEPSGYLHLGHAKAVLLNQHFAQTYKGQLIVRFDDTNPSKEKEEFTQSIIEDLRLMGVKEDRVTHTSQYFPQLIKYAEMLIKQGDGYVDDTNQETMRQQRFDGIASKSRSLSVEENMKRWEEMKAATEFGLKCCLRAKMSVDDKNKALRDPVMFRCNLTPHHKTGTEYKVYPTYDFACFGEDDARVLTNQGFLYLAEIEEYLGRSDAPQLLYACFDKTKASLVYCPGMLVLPANPGQRLIDISQDNERVRWNGADEYGNSHCEELVDNTNQLSIRVTPDHEVLVTRGNKIQGYEEVSWASQDSSTLTKEPASQLMTECNCPPEEINCEHRRKWARFLAVAVNGVIHDDIGFVNELAEQLGLSTSAQMNAFMELYGFWLGNGTISSVPREHGNNHILAFSQIKQADLEWLCSTLPAAGLIKGVDWSIGNELKDGKTWVVLIHRHSWVKLFAIEYNKGYELTNDCITNAYNSPAKWFCWWVQKRLGLAHLRLIIKGLHRTNGSFSNDGTYVIYTSSVAFRDELVVIMLHAGYTATFSFTYKAGAIKGYCRGDELKVYSVAEVTGHEAEFEPIMATTDEWAIRYCEPISTAGKKNCMPSIRLHSAVSSVSYTKRVWCVRVEHDDHLIVAQRAHSEGGVVTKTSRPIIIGQCPIVDSVEGVTHALRTDEYHDRNPQYQWVLDKLKLRKVHIWDFSRVNFVYTLLSKRKMQWFVDSGLVSGWDDPRMPTVRGIRRRGLTVEGLKQYILMQGASTSALMLEWDKLWSLNKRLIDVTAPRYVALDTEQLVAAEIIQPSKEMNKVHYRSLARHKKNLELGDKRTAFFKHLWLDRADVESMEEGEEVTMMDWGNMMVVKLHRDGNGDNARVTRVELKLNLEGDVKTTKKKLTWLVNATSTPQSEDVLVDCLLLDYDYLITKKRLEEDDDVKDFVTPVTEFKIKAMGDANLKELKHGDIIQLERRGYYICDKPYSNKESPIHLIFIPDGKAASINLKHDALATASRNQNTGSTPIGSAVKTAHSNEYKGMYQMASVYGDQHLDIDPSTISKMYTVKTAYGANGF